MISRLFKKRFDVMHHPHHEHRDSFEYVVKLLRSEVVYDFEQLLYKYGQFNGLKDEGVEAYTLTEEEQDWFDLRFRDAIGKVNSKLKPYVVEHSRLVSDDMTESNNEYDIVLRHGESWLGSPSNVMTFVHDYCLYYIASEWFKNGGDHNNGAYYAKYADENLRQAYSEVNSYDVERVLGDL